MYEQSEYRGQSEYWRGVNNAKARQAWADLLSTYSWDAFLTSTDSKQSIRGHPLSVLGRVRRTVLGTSPVSRLFLAAEQFRLGGWHCHGLVSWDVPAKNYLLSNQNFELNKRLSVSGFSSVGEADSIVAVSNYLSKYVVKDTPWEWDIAGRGWGNSITP